MDSGIPLKARDDGDGRHPMGKVFGEFSFYRDIEEAKDYEETLAEIRNILKLSRAQALYYIVSWGMHKVLDELEEQGLGSNKTLTEADGLPYLADRARQKLAEVRSEQDKYDTINAL